MERLQAQRLPRHCERSRRHAAALRRQQPDMAPVRAQSAHGKRAGFRERHLAQQPAAQASQPEQRSAERSANEHEGHAGVQRSPPLRARRGAAQYGCVPFACDVDISFNAHARVNMCV